MPEYYDYVIVGAGFSGLVLAERLGSLGNRCLVVERRSHLGGNCYDRTDRNGLLYHVYGPHYFRTNVAEVREYLSAFTEWREVKYQVNIFTEDRYWSFPINLGTFRQLSGNAQATTADFENYLRLRRVPKTLPANSREVVESAVGRELYEKFYRGYTLKQWGRPAEALDASVCGRIPIRTNLDDRYFQESFQALPKHGYTAMFENLFNASHAELRLETDYREILPHLKYGHLIYTGPVDEYFDCRWGALPYRTLRFQLEELSPGQFKGPFAQPVLQVNYPGSEAFTRTVEVKHITGQSSAATNVVREFSAEYRAGKSEPYYPVPGAETRALAEKYRQLAAREPGVSFIGRLAEYRYLNMDQIVAGALHHFEKLRAAPVPARA